MILDFVVLRNLVKKKLFKLNLDFVLDGLSLKILLLLVIVTVHAYEECIYLNFSLVFDFIAVFNPVLCNHLLKFQNLRVQKI